MLEANRADGAVELLETRPEHLTSNDVGGEQVAAEHFWCNAVSAFMSPSEPAVRVRAQVLL